MVEQVSWIDDDAWETIVSNAPVPSVDLVVDCDDGILLAERQNEPAKGEWFVPGGRIQKGEPVNETVHRVAREELGVSVTIEAALGTYDHFYDTADVPGAGGKHYVAHGFLVKPESESVTLDDQHGEARVFGPEELPELHPYVQDYFQDAELIVE